MPSFCVACSQVLEKYPNTPMSHKEILQVIQREGLKEISGTSPLACLNAMLHTNSRGAEGIFYKVPGRMGVYTLKKDVSDSAKELSEEGSEESSDNASDSQSTENGSNSNPKESRKGKWRRRVPSKLSPQPPSPQSRCTSPSVPAGKLISSSQKHSKKALKQALKQQQQRNQRRQGGVSSMSNPRLVLGAAKDMAETMSARTAWEVKQSARRSTSPQNSSSSSSSSSSGKTEPCASTSTRKISQRSDRLTARHLKRTKCAEIDVETPDSILVNTNLRALMNKHTLSLLPQECQQRLLRLLPEVDRQTCTDGQLKLSSSALNNEFFTSAAQSWKERLAEGEFTPEMRLRIRQEIDKEKKVEPWKECFFESYYGQNSGLSLEESSTLLEPTATEVANQSHSALPLCLQAAAANEAPEIESEKSPTITMSAKPGVTDVEAAGEPAAKADQLPVLVGPECETHAAVLPNFTSTSAPIETEEASGKVSAGETEPECKCSEQVRLSPQKEAKASPCREAPPADQTSTEFTGKMPEAEHMETEVTQEPLKRKTSFEEEAAVTPEKKPRVSELPPRTSPEVKGHDSSPRVPPLKIPVSRIVQVPAAAATAAGQVSPRSPFPAPIPSPGRPGARTLADIKAKAQLRRAQSAAAAAAAAAAVSSSGGAVPGPGPGGGNGDSSGSLPKGELSSSLSRSQTKSTSFVNGSSQTQSQHSAPPASTSKAASLKSSTTQTPATCPSTSSLNKDLPNVLLAPDEKEAQKLPKGQLSTSPALGNMGSQTVRKSLNASTSLENPKASHGASVTDTVAPHWNKGTFPGTFCCLLTASGQNTQEHLHTGVSAVKASSSITSNNPLVAQLLQGIEVPLEQILPKPLTELQPVMVPSGDKGKLSASAASNKSQLAAVAGAVDKTKQLVSNQLVTARAGALELSQHQGEMLTKATQEQILQTLMQRTHSQQFAPKPQPGLKEVCLLSYSTECPSTPRFAVGFSGRKRMSKPAMSGHYLLNISTYGRGSEGCKRVVSTMPTILANLKKEYTEGEGIPDSEPARGHQHSPGADLPGVKVEHQGPSDDPDSRNSEGTLYSQQQQKIKSEFPSHEHVPDRKDIADQTISSFATFRAKETEQVPQPLAGHLALGNNSQSNSASIIPEPYRLQVHATTNTNHSPTSAQPMQKTQENEGSYSYPLKHSSTSAGSPTSYSTASSSNGNVMSISVTVTTISASHSSHGEAAPLQAFNEASSLDDPPSNCYCRLKAMIMCKGCGAFCHDDCIGPSKLCVSCLVVR
ncbi:putative Polycomb group protein ASXL2 isoform X2 [Arapaima gigas]